jgi:hypothetical protein
VAPEGHTPSLSQERYGMLPAGSLSVSRRGVIHHAFARAPESVPRGWRGAIRRVLTAFARRFFGGVPQEVQEKLLPGA